MTKEILFSIRSYQSELDPEERIEQTVRGKYHYRNKKHYIFYEEKSEDPGNPGTTRCRITITETTVDVVKKGAVSSHMFFEKDQRTTTCYMTPFGQLLTSFYTYSLSLSEKPDLIRLQLRYELQMERQHISECELWMELRALEEEQG